MKTFISILIIASVAFASCSKSVPQAPEKAPNKYNEMIKGKKVS